MPEPFEVQLARIDEQVKSLRQVVEGAKFIAESVHRNAERLAVHEERFNEMRADIASLEGRMESAVGRVEKSCNDLGTLLREASERAAETQRDVITVKSEQSNQRAAFSRREKWLLALASIFGSGAVALIVHLLT